MFEKMTTINQLNERINQSEITFVYFGHPDCSVCHGLKPQIDAKLNKFEKDILFLDVNTFEIPEVAGEYSVMTVPVVILFVNGKEYLRQARFVPVQDLYNQVEKIVTGIKGE
ncbi:thioredoxin family protein [Vagococcus sp. DIV0080]|uniref:Thioredoxin family protein n=1 Tax=Candidatus Vagococcus giribetii TaxID=2230876 RepID=A0ABS3HW50_9ENTE|nr:thioredoxin family protein [Vagococcus sp. DIV0080]MBO0477983.1 thioredoxin family protein [Vagococcus sp. DIV0080]